MQRLYQVDGVGARLEAEVVALDQAGQDLSRGGHGGRAGRRAGKRSGTMSQLTNFYCLLSQVYSPQAWFSRSAPPPSCKNGSSARHAP